MIARWMLPLMLAVAFFAGTITSWAASGVIGETKCCCPVPKKCKCHDHDEAPTTAKLKRCSGEAKLVTPAPIVADVLEAFEVETAIVADALPAIAPPVLVDQFGQPPEKPPF